MKDIIIKHNKGEISLKTLEEDNNLDLEQVPENNEAQIIKSLIDKIKELSEKPKEYILCAAIHIKDGNVSEHKPVNITSGLVIVGRRHYDCYTIIKEIYNIDDYQKLKEIQGFLTNTNRFVDRKEAYLIAKAANQNQQYFPIM